ncbi:hypothetical protein PBI_LUCKY2013_218 [Mycobacterium phage Lucky2013]|uniref:hypothetical protein n=1 Tax=Mycobacterium phage MiaZeal TaxID=1567005 RepID=UPI0005409B20|nr:hypothetical protein AVV70_gp209 [Mycobacterium phage MiaZeal]AIY32582.1 hypothetical protein PBI_MIAZEAL_230 [Mycobacterium phage MiaZeal]ASD50828.1 hypothetical protein PORCELAIN_221 [Mycobacterium phage Porcelain]ASD53609.1 hypothetical protein PBI_LUCKY2013_218 [Mycobacterium phage Lucky2013]ASZ74294.1 hypothetical protein SEA_SQUINT_219 [Mycobacterium phage Squint]
MTEMLRSVQLHEFRPGDHFVKPSRDLYGFPVVYGTDRDGYASLRVDAGTRFEVVAVGDDWVTARHPNGDVITQENIPQNAAALKVVERPEHYR